jgi:FkbH-like protein
MYETEVNTGVRGPAEIGIPDEVVRAFRELSGRMAARTALPWAEHCTECAAPACYETCDLYAPRPDGKCRRLVEGMVRVPLPGSANGYLLDVTFKKWGMLHAKGNAHLVPAERASAREKTDWRRARLLRAAPLPGRIRQRLQRQLWREKWGVASRGGASGPRPHAFVVEVWNPDPEDFDATLILRPKGRPDRPPFQERVLVPTGFRRIEVPVDRFAGMVPLDEPIDVDLTPNESAHGGRVVLGLLDLVAFASSETPRESSSRSHDATSEKMAARGGRTPAESPASRVKCVVWDLDRTLWDGILIEDGLEGVALRPGVRETLLELDRRGILLSVASKNDPADGRVALARFELDHLFLHPQMSWEPKSTMVARIARSLDIGLDTFLFVDDQPFERAEVAAVHPTVRALDGADPTAVLAHPGCQVAVTAEGARRRLLYREEAVRRDALDVDHQGDYEAFLRGSEIEVTIAPLTPEDLDRVHELTQRTNQMNFSGTRYRREHLEAMLHADTVDTHVIRVQDRFGSYGTVGFGVVDPREPRLRDLMFSCRVQAKRVEHAVLSVLIARYRERGASEVWASWRKSERNRPAGRVFEDLGFEERDERDGTTDLVYPGHRPTPAQDLLTVRIEADARSGAGS